MSEAAEILQSLEGLFLSADKDESGALDIEELTQVVGQWYKKGALDHPVCLRSRVPVTTVEQQL